jgi:hypothetical protein
VESIEQILESLEGQALSTARLGRIFGKSAFTIRQWILKKRLVAYRIGNEWSIDPPMH